MKQHFIVAANKPWHLPLYESKIINRPGEWHFASDANSLRELLSFVNPSFIFFLHWSEKVEVDILKQYYCVCFHMTDLPFGRGGSPLQNLISLGYEETALSAIKMEEELDAGPIIAKKMLPLSGKAEEIYVRAAKISWTLIDEIIHLDVIKETPQTGTVTYFKRRKPSQSRLPIDSTLKNLYDHIRMLDAQTYPKAFISIGNFHFEFSEAELKHNSISAKVEIIKKEQED